MCITSYSPPPPTLESLEVGAMPLNLLQDWCRGEHLNTQRSMLILGIPEDCSEDEFEETLHEALKHLGRYRIIGRMFRREENAQA